MMWAISLILYGFSLTLHGQPSMPPTASGVASGVEFSTESTGQPSDASENLAAPVRLAAVDKPEPGPASGETPAEQTSQEADPASLRTELNLLGQTDAKSGESRRNENVQFNLIDNNALKELNQRLGTTPTAVAEFQPQGNYFSTEYGNPASMPIHLPGTPLRGFHGRLNYGHLNSIFSARAFFQVGAVKPARENEWGATVGIDLWKGAAFTFNGNQQKIRGNVNGNVLVPKDDERTPLTTDPILGDFVARILNAYPPGTAQPHRYQRADAEHQLAADRE